MDRKLAKYLLLIPLFEIGNSLADLSQEGQNFGGNMLEKQQSTLNEKEANEKLQNLPGYQAYQNGNGTKEEAENSRAIKEMQGTFSANMDRGLKNDDPIKSELTKNNAKKLESATKSNEPSLNQTTELLKQKHRWHINDEDPVFFGSNAVSKSKEKVEKERAEISSVIKKVEGSNAASAIILCREGIKPVNVTCQKRLKMIPIIQGQETKTVTISISEDFPTWYLWGHHGRKVYVDLKTGGIKSSEGNPPNMSIDKPLGSMNNAEKAEVTLSSQTNEHSHANLSIFTLTESPSAGNGFVATFQLYRGFYGFFHNWSKKATYVWKVIIQPKPTLEEHWEGCELEEKRVKENYCTLMAKEQKEKNETKRINGYPDLVTKDFWLEEREYLCGLGSQANECEKLKKEGCEQIASQCVKGEKESCIEYEQTYRCKPKAFQKESDVVIPKIPNEDEIKKAVSDNSQSFGTEDFGEALAEFGALTEMGNQMKDGLGGIKGDPKNPSVFHGECQRCSIKLGSSIQDCCQLSGLALGLIGGCREGEKKLAVASVKDKRCHKVQEKYCATKVLKVCVEEKEAYCCYGSQIAKIIQEIAHQQLNISWGSGENPNCGSLTVEQLSRLDFDTPFAREKLSTLMSEMQATAQEKLNKVQGKITGRGDMNNRLEALQKSLGNHFSKGHPQRSDNTVSPKDSKHGDNK